MFSLNTTFTLGTVLRPKRWNHAQNWAGCMLGVLCLPECAWFLCKVHPLKLGSTSYRVIPSVLRLLTKFMSGATDDRRWSTCEIVATGVAVPQCIRFCSQCIAECQRGRSQRLKVKKFKWLSQRKAIIALGCSVLFEFLDLLSAFLTCLHVLSLSYISLAILSKTLQFCFRLYRLDVLLVPFKLLLYHLLPIF